MAIVTLRLNEEEDKALALLVKYLDEDKSRILKDAMWEKFEELRDREIIEEFEKKSKNGKIEFVNADAFVKQFQGKDSPIKTRIERSPSARHGTRLRKRTSGSVK
jgi:predicted DNA-binding protein